MAVGGRVLTREPHRTCAGCRAVDRKVVLVRVAGGSASSGGRGAHVHPRASCFEAALRGGLARSLRRQITDAERASLAQLLVNPSHLAAGLDSNKAVETLPRPEAKE